MKFNVQISVVHGVSTRLAALLERCCCPPPQKRGFSKVSFHGTGISVEGDIRKIMAQINQTGTATAAFVNRHGQPVEVESSEWTSSDETVATVVADPSNPLVGIITTLNLGDTIISCSDLDPDNDVSTDGALAVTGLLQVLPDNVTAGGGLVFGEFTDAPV